MSFEADMYTYLSTHATLMAQVADRIFPHNAPTDTPMPYINYFLITEDGQHQLLAAAGIANPTIQFDIWGKNSIQRYDTLEALRNVIDGFRGTWGSTEILAVSQTRKNYDVEEPDDGSQQRDYRGSVDYRIWWRRAVPTG